MTRLLLFAAPPLVASTAPILVLGAIAHTGGSAVWLSLLIGQAIGGIGCLITTWGWDIGGPARVAAAESRAQRAQLLVSLAARLPIAVVMLVVGSLIALSIAPQVGVALSVIAAASGTVQGLSLNWWFTGLGRPGKILLTDVAPRVLAAGLSAVLIIRGAPAVIYPAIGLTLTLVAYAFAYAQLLRGQRWPSFSETFRSIRMDGRLALIAVTTSAYTTATLPLVQGINPAAAPAFGATQRIAGYWTFSTQVLGNTAQNWVNREGRRAVAHRGRIMLIVFAVEGIVLGAALWLLGPLVAAVIFGRENSPPSVVFAAFGMTFFAVAVSTALGRLLLIPLGRESQVGSVTIVSAVVGVASLIFGTIHGGAVGAAFAVAVTELLATVMLGVFAARELKRVDDGDSLRRTPDEPGDRRVISQFPSGGETVEPVDSRSIA